MSLTRGIIHYYDIKTTLRTEDGEIDLILNVEMQRDPNPGYNLKMRGSYYVARNFSEQLKDLSKEENYNKLKKVYSIWIVANSTKPEIVRYSFMNTKTKKVDSDNDPFSLIMIYLGKEKSKEKVIQYIKALFERDMKYLKKYYVINEDMERSIDSMCNLSQGIREEGIEQGIEQGMEKKEKEIALKMLKKGQLSLEEIADYSGLSLEKIEELAKIVK